MSGGRFLCSVATTLLALSIPHVLYAAEARFYALFVLTTVLNLYAFAALGMHLVEGPRESTLDLKDDPESADFMVAYTDDYRNAVTAYAGHWVQLLDAVPQPESGEGSLANALHAETLESDTIEWPVVVAAAV